MALLTIDDFRWCSGLASFQIGAQNGAAASIGVVDAPYNGRYAWSPSSSTGIYLTPNNTVTTSFVTGCMVKMISSYGGNIFFRCFAGGGQAFALEYKLNGTFVLYRSVTVVAVAECPPAYRRRLSEMQWLEVKATISNTVGTLDFYVNGCPIFNLTGLNNNNQTTSNDLDKVAWISDASDDPGTAHMYLMDQTGSANNDVLGGWAVETIYPDGAGTTTDFTPDSGSNYARVNETVADGDTSYVDASVVDDIDLYTYAALSNSFTAINGVQVNAMCRKTAPGDRLVRQLARSVATTGEAAASAPSIDYARESGIFETDPNGGGAWTESSVNAAEFGITIES